MQNALKKVMTTNLFVVAAGTSLGEAMNLMAEKRIRHLPVVNDSAEIIGVLSQNPLFHLENMQTLKVDAAMSTHVFSVDQNMPLRKAIFKFLENKISCLLVVDKNLCVVGIVTTDDLLWHLSTFLKDPSQKRFSFSSLFDMQTVGEVAQRAASITL